VQRTQTYGLVALSIGIFLIAFVNVGLGLMGFAVVGDLVKEDFNSMSAWSIGDQGGGSAIISPAGQCYFTTTSRCNYVQARAANFPSQLTIEVKVVVDNWGISNGEFYIWLQDGTYTHLLSIASDRCRVATPAGDPIEWFYVTTSIGTWYTWTVTIDTVGNQQKVYRQQGTNAVENVGTTNKVYKPSNNAPKYASFNQAVSTGTVSSHIDSLCIDTGLKPPGGGPPPTYGSLRVYGYKNNAKVASWNAYCKKGTVTTSTQSCSVANAGLLFSNLEPGTWTVYGTYTVDGTQETVDAAVSAGDTPATANLDFGGGAPDNDTDPFQWLRDFLKNPVFKASMTGVGALLSMVGIFALIIPAVRKKQPSYGYGF